MAFAFNQAEFEEVEFQTLDQLTLKARLYPASKRGPAIIMNPGFNCTKEISAPNAAAYFQRHGITAFVYDPRNCGQSDGTPRREIDPHKQVDDYLDALTFVTGLDIVDPTQIGLWGVSFSASIALAAACYDPRARLVMAISPWTFEFGVPVEQAKQNFARLVSDRESQALGNEPFYTPMVDRDGNNPIHLGVDWGDEVRAAVADFTSLSADGFVPTVTFQSYYKVFTFSPYVAIPYLGDTPLMVVVPDHDTISPVEQQVRLYEAIKGPKEIYHAAGKRHLNMLQEDATFGPMMQAQVDFFYKAITEGDGGW